ncbi:MAG: hypothetical protein E7101_04890 [Prevotella ruminicola]|jgi:hypothetical protein|uniref:Uncharacterized protein n=1 Tax=Xylanibacter ruminicola TaxID=839 RepID=A0A9D5NZZ2_XYLRU|nr:hypothetical protein [Xylanibacter ruminicola]
MELKVNRTNIEVFEGAEIRHALLTYLTRRRMSLKFLEQFDIRDEWGHEVSLDAPASAFTQIKLSFKS